MRDHLVFYVNGTRHAVRGAPAALTLSDYLRGDLGGPIGNRLAGTKVACAEGDCGACTVLVGAAIATGQCFDFQAIDACIAFVYQMDRRHIVTVEGLRRGEALSEIQSAMIDCHGSQCGFCTPGFVMALHGMVEQSTSDEAPRRFSDDQLRLGLSGNLCRCTGYAQILDAGRRIDVSMVDRASTAFDTPAMRADFAALESGPVHVNARSDSEQNGAANGALPNSQFAIATRPCEIYLPSTLQELLDRRARRPEATLVAGATDLGVQHNHGKLAPNDVLTIGRIKELEQLEVDGDQLVIGAAVSWARIAEFVRDLAPEYYNVLMRFGSPQIRHAGTLAGNLANASPIADSIPFHYVAGSTIQLASIRGQREVEIEKFYVGYKRIDLAPDEIITSVRTPLPKPTDRLKLYKISKRRDMDISAVTAAFWIQLDDEVIRSARIAVGGVGQTVVRLPLAEARLRNIPLTAATMRIAGQAARSEISPITDVRGSAMYRLQLVENLFVKCYHDLVSTGNASPPVASE